MLELQFFIDMVTIKEEKIGVTCDLVAFVSAL
jgi:hypothetical protein